MEKYNNEILELSDLKICIKCKEKMDKKAKFCPKCGEEQPIEEEQPAMDVEVVEEVNSKNEPQESEIVNTDSIEIDEEKESSEKNDDSKTE